MKRPIIYVDAEVLKMLTQLKAKHGWKSLNETLRYEFSLDPEPQEVLE